MACVECVTNSSWSRGTRWLNLGKRYTKSIKYHSTTVDYEICWKSERNTHHRMFLSMNFSWASNWMKTYYQSHNYSCTTCWRMKLSPRALMLMLKIVCGIKWVPILTFPIGAKIWEVEVHVYMYVLNSFNRQ